MRYDKTLGALEEAQHRAVATAKRRIETAEESVAIYRSHMRRMQEDVYAIASREGVAEDPGFRFEFQRISDEVEEEVRRASQAISRLEEDLSAMAIRHSQERERFLEEQHLTTGRSTN